MLQVIEILIRIEDGLARDVVKHLQNIEEQILERFAWKSSSPFWATLEACEEGVPSCEAVALPQGQAQPTLHSLIQSPVSHFRAPAALLQSPGTDRFQSPTLVRQLFTGQAPASLPASGLASPRTNIENTPPAPALTPRKASSLNLFFRKVRRKAKMGEK